MSASELQLIINSALNYANRTETNTPEHRQCEKRKHYTEVNMNIVKECAVGSEGDSLYLHYGSDIALRFGICILISHHTAPDTHTHRHTQPKRERERETDHAHI